MLPEPLHPAVVHFPIVLAALLPFAGLTLFWAIRAGRLQRSGWLAVVALQVLLGISAWAALETGEHEEERVERVVSERLIEDHEEDAERFALAATVGLPIAVAGLLGGALGVAARGLAVAASLVVLGLGTAAGHSGGELVYGHGAALAYSEGGPSPRASTRHYEEDDDDD